MYGKHRHWGQGEKMNNKLNHLLKYEHIISIIQIHYHIKV